MGFGGWTGTGETESKLLLLPCGTGGLRHGVGYERSILLPFHPCRLLNATLATHTDLAASRCDRTQLFIYLVAALENGVIATERMPIGFDTDVEMSPDHVAVVVAAREL